MATRYKNALKYDKRDHMTIEENDEEFDEIESEDAMSQSNQTNFSDAIINIYDLLKNWTHDMALDVFDNHKFSIEDVSQFLSE
uniref:Uncharacterized protein n=1 Tax=Marseillevirus LCMAC102 TaxID=2506603 RepID=A0A481YVR9_9VIRU|nr:MAG: hypothetical protein LCMAC102_03910 [Marseillevirus LCMAC102]